MFVVVLGFGEMARPLQMVRPMCYDASFRETTRLMSASYGGVDFLEDERTENELV